MYISIYQTKNRKWRAEVSLNAETRSTKTFELEVNAKRCAKEKQRDEILEDSTKKALGRQTIITVEDALGRYDPSYTGNNAALAVIAPPQTLLSPYRILEVK